MQCGLFDRFDCDSLRICGRRAAGDSSRKRCFKFADAELDAISRVLMPFYCYSADCLLR
jgi:hypothetical protein